MAARPRRINLDGSCGVHRGSGLLSGDVRQRWVQPGRLGGHASAPQHGPWGRHLLILSPLIQLLNVGEELFTLENGADTDDILLCHLGSIARISFLTIILPVPSSKGRPLRRAANDHSNKRVRALRYTRTQVFMLEKKKKKKGKGI